MTPEGIRGDESPWIRRLFATSVFCLLLSLFRFPFWEAVTVYLLVLSCLSIERVKAAAALNILFMLATGSLFALTISHISASPMSWPAQTNRLALGPLLTAAVMVASAALFFSYYLASFRLFERFRRIRFPVLWSLLVLCAAGLALRAWSGESPARLVCVGAFLALSKTFWTLSYQLSEVDHLKSKPLWLHFGTLNAPWQIGWVNNPVLRGCSDYLNTQLSGGAELQSLRWSAVRLLFGSLCLKVLAEKMGEYFFHASVSIGPLSLDGLSPHFQTPSAHAGFMPPDLAWWEAWLFVMATGLYFLTSYAAITNAAVGVVRMCGFSIRSNVHEPHQATSFNDFLSRIYFYYIAVLQRFFFYPLWHHLRFIPSRGGRVFLVVFLTICGGGLAVAFTRLAPHILAPGGHAYIQSLLRIRLPYFLLLGVLSACSALLPAPPSPLRGRAGRLCLSFFYFLAYSVCFSLQFSERPGIFEGIREKLFLLAGLS